LSRFNNKEIHELIFIFALFGYYVIIYCGLAYKKIMTFIVV
jgi:hypothetical protein